MDRGEIKKELGLTQEEMAMLLGVALGQWKMYKSGQRRLPPKPMQKLTALSQNIQMEKGTPEEISKFLSDEERQTKMKLKDDALKMEIKISRIQKEITILENNRSEALAAFQTIAQLRKEEVPDEGLILIIRDRALKTLNKYNSYSLGQLQLKLQGFELMKAVIQQKIKLAGA
ncbi:helix-turn-helix transcriptional regulator [Flavobacterium amniphilum]|uniref:helix-turn-helix transcriptional regulator n=1 Tax=Flavobacterium amniphilum TaxID=1834035 RepID=UPI00202AB1E9|nr:helix-turn-helix transcriptional regulator [Flavobacterium amniphilum]MCL9805232.1 helix-turn-helix transcriptional regulator [Flavobacterium amniphilum]